MTDLSTHRPARRLWRPDGWAVLALALAALVILPIATVVWIALNPVENIWPHMMATTLPRYLTNSAVLMAGVGILAGIIGTGTAWLVVMTRFPGRAVLEWALLLPFALPAYIAAFAVVDFFEYAGPLQTALRGVFEWETRRDYTFPEVRSRGFAIVVLAFALYPYVYFLARSVFRSQSAAALEVARALGETGWGAFWRVGLPLARPAVVAGVAIVMMETLNEFGAMEFFGVQTLTTGIFTVWLEASNAGGAAQLACVILVFVLVLVALEKVSRRNIRFHETARQVRPPQPEELHGWRAALAAGACSVPVLVGFVAPLLILSDLGISRMGAWASADLWMAAGRSVFMAAAAALITVSAAVLLVYGARMWSQPMVRGLIPVTTIGYAAPGAVLGLGVLVPLAWADHRFADTVLYLTGYDPGLLLVGSAGAVIFAYSVRFFAIAVGTVDAAFGKVSPNLGPAARSLGHSTRGVLRRVHLPLIRGSIGTAALLIFVDCVKELPATLLLFSEKTLATEVYNRASAEDFAGAAPPALFVVLVSLIAFGVMAVNTRSG
ncbi:MAG: iron ABC transporter permease [Pseudomonadota bacterium]